MASETKAIGSFGAAVLCGGLLIYTIVSRAQQPINVPFVPPVAEAQNPQPAVEAVPKTKDLRPGAL